MVENSLTERVEALEVFRDEVRQEFQALREELRKEIREGDEKLRKEIREGDAETRRQMRVLHEDLVDRFKTLGEQLNGDPHRPKSRRRR